MKFGFGAEVVVGLPVVANVSVLYMAEVQAHIGDKALVVTGLLLFRGSAEICGGLVGITIQIEAGGAVSWTPDATEVVTQVAFTIDVCVLWSSTSITRGTGRSPGRLPSFDGPDLQRLCQASLPCCPPRNYES